MRKRILDATADAFQKRGYHSTSTHDIVRAAGVTAGALHHHFPTKKALALNVIEERVAQAVDKHWLEPVRSARGAEQGIRTAFEQIASALDRSRTILGCPLNNLALELCAADFEFREAIERIYDNWRKVIADKLRADFVGAFDAEVLATFVIASYSGAIAQAKAKHGSSSDLCRAVGVPLSLKANVEDENRPRFKAVANFRIRFGPLGGVDSKDSLLGANQIQDFFSGGGLGCDGAVGFERRGVGTDGAADHRPT